MLVKGTLRLVEARPWYFMNASVCVAKFEHSDIVIS